MKKATVGWLFVILVLGLLAAGCAQPPASAPAPPPSEKTPSPSEKASAPAGAVHQVIIQNFAFSPQEITIKVGDTVTWTEQDRTPHTTTGSIWDSGTLRQGETYSKTFDKAGTYDYLCTIHPSIKGKVIVEEP